MVILYIYLAIGIAYAGLIFYEEQTSAWGGFIPWFIYPITIVLWPAWAYFWIKNR